MTNNQTKTTPVCSKCNKPLVKAICFACYGKGYQREWLFIKSECPKCHGTGWILHCPDEASHIAANIKSIKKPLSNSFRQPLKDNSAIKTPSVLKNPPFLKNKVPLPPKVPPPGYLKNINPLDRFNPQSPFNPNNPNSPWNINNPQNPNSLRNPHNPNSPLYKNPFKK